MMRSTLLTLLVASASAFAPVQQARAVTSLNAEEMSKSIPFLVKPDKLDGSMPGDMGFDPMRLSDIQTDLKYARWAELKHGRICMLAITGMIVQEAGIHLPGAQFTNTDPFGAIGSVGFAGNLQVFLFIAILEGANFMKHYGDGTPGDIGLDGGLLKKLSADQIEKRQVQEIVHGRLAMIAFTGALVQTLLFKQPLLG